MPDVSKGEHTRERIVAEAAALLNQRGLEGVSLSDLMRATGLEKGGIYRHFSGKEDIALRAFDHAWRASLEARTRGLDAVPHSVDKLKRYIANFVERRPRIPGGCPLLNTAIDADDGNPRLRRRARKALAQWRVFLESIVIAGIARKEIRRGIRPVQVANLIISSLEGALMMSRLDRDRDALLTAQAHLQQYLDREVRFRPFSPVRRPRRATRGSSA